MNILFIAPRFHSNQIDLIKKLKEEGHNVNFLVIRIGASEEHSLIKPFLIPLAKKTEKLLGINNINDIYVARAIPKIFKYYRIIKQFKPNVIVLRGGFSSVYSFFLIPYLLVNKVKLVYYTQGPKYVNSLPFSRRLHDFLIAKLFKIRWYTPVKYIESKEHSLDLNYIDFLPFFIYPKVKNPKKKPETLIHFLCIGKYEKRKNLHLVIDAAAEIKKMQMAFSITIIGSAEKREEFYCFIKKKIDELDLKAEVKILKDLPQTQMSNYYSESDVFILPSEKESASISQIEAMAFGMPVICSKDNGTAHYVKNDFNGILISPNVSELKEAMLFYINNKEMVEKHSKASIHLIKTEFSIDTSYTKFMKIISNK